jgi:hypothetical protein
MKKVMINGQAFNFIFKGSNMVVILDESVKGEDKRRVVKFDDAEVVFADNTKFTAKPTKRKRRRLNGAEKLFMACTAEQVNAKAA